MTFANKQITVIFTLGQGNFGDTGSNQVTLTGLRISAKITSNAWPQTSMCQLRIFGLTPLIYNTLTSIYPTAQGVQRNTLTVQAGDEGSGTPATVFVGQITVAQIDLNSQPDVVMNVIAEAALLAKIQTTTPSSFPAGTPVATALQSLATTGGLRFVNAGVTKTLSACYLWGTVGQQINKVLQMTDTQVAFENNTLIISPTNTPRSDISVVPVISYKDNMIGYPSYSQIGIGLKCYFNPNIVMNSTVQVVSSLEVKQLNGLWLVFDIVHTLESMMPGGQWMTECQGQALQRASNG
jgi:hypothetical protein